MGKVIVGIGEILWDMLPTGKALGGAPANFAYHAARLGAEGWAVSAVGNDVLGNEILDILKAKKLKHLIEFVGQPTGTVQVTLDSKGVPSYNIMEDVAWDNIHFTEEMRALAGRTDAVCFGSLVQRMNSRAAVLDFIKSMPESSLKVFDINLRQKYYNPVILETSFNLSDILKINDEEIRVVANMFSLGADDVTASRALIDRYSLDMVILTKGEGGSMVITDKEVIEHPAEKVDVIDTVGAGDAFTAAFVVSCLNGDSLAEAQRKASETAAFVCSRKGAMPD
jgi:fructokinase